jgi:hypothetical protein
MHEINNKFNFAQGSCHGDTPPMNHTNYIYFLNSYGIALSLMFVLFKPRFQRSAANQIQPEVQITKQIQNGESKEQKYSLTA